MTLLETIKTQHNNLEELYSNYRNSPADTAESRAMELRGDQLYTILTDATIQYYAGQGDADAVADIKYWRDRNHSAVLEYTEKLI